MLKGFGERRYRQWRQSADLRSFIVTVGETDLFILAQEDLSEFTTSLVKGFRADIQTYSAEFPEFRNSLSPCAVTADAPPIIRAMAAAATEANVGPFAAVAGAMAEFVGKELLAYSPEILIENGGDIFAMSRQDRSFGIYAGDSPFTGRLALKIAASHMPCGVCTSSGTLGHSLSFGKADALIVLARSTPAADAWATSLANMISVPNDIPRTIAYAEKHAAIEGLVAIVGDNIGAWGAIEFVKT